MFISIIFLVYLYECLYFFLEAIRPRKFVQKMLNVASLHLYHSLTLTSHWCNKFAHFVFRNDISFPFIKHPKVFWGFFGASCQCPRQRTSLSQRYFIGFGSGYFEGQGNFSIFSCWRQSIDNLAAWSLALSWWKIANFSYEH